jgi:hypothetical protein
MRGTGSRGWRFAILAGGVLCLAACVSDDESTLREGSAPAEPMAGGARLNRADTTLTLQQQVDIARSDLAQTRGIDPGSIGVAEVRNVTWRSGAIGCPKPDMFYTQALVPGTLIVLQVGRETFAYHARNDGQPFHCPPERAEQPAAGTSASELQ